MPLLPSTYKAPPLFISKHIETIYPVLFRKITDLAFERERLELKDGDFLDLDWIKKGNTKLLILSHGLEGNTESIYLRGMARAAAREGYDVLAWNYRGCSGEPNRLFRFYHSGESNDLRLVLDYVLATTNYHSIGLIGFSVGGNITLKYLGEQGSTIHSKIKAALAFSVPCDLKAGAAHMAGLGSKIYMNRFLRNLHQKIKSKQQQYPGQINDSGYEKIKNFIDFDERYTAPIHGFKNADDYYKKSSSVNYMHNIQLPTLLINALNDPFLVPACFPFEQARNNPAFDLETPARGGHCGFYEKNSNGNYWSDNRALDYFSSRL